MNLAVLKAVTVIMGVMIVVGVAVLGATLFNRLSSAGSTATVDEPIALSPPEDSVLLGAAAYPDGLVLTFRRAQPDGTSDLLISIHEVETGRRIGYFALPDLTAQ